ncbi:MAG TPA: thioredoxin TrxC [Burkholderiales bacterium]|jgi:thioredoxin 2|nr:thioredoxin TrxC [Burkholderiales bacterium]
MDFQHHVPCPHCDTLNRVPAARLGDGPKCGKCKQPLFAGAPFVLSDANFAAQVERASLPLLVDFWAPWCGPCRMMAPHFERAAGQLEPGVRLAKLNTDENPQTAARLRIRSIPTLILFRDGREIARQAGALDARRLVEWVRSHL